MKTQMTRRILATLALLGMCAAPLWAQGKGGGLGGGLGGKGGVKGGGPTTPPAIPDEKTREGCEWVEPYPKALETAQTGDKFFLVYVCEDKGNGNVLANDFYALDVIHLSKTTWVFSKIPYAKDDPALRKLGVKKAGTVLGFDKHGNEWRRLETLSTIELKGLLASVPDLVKKFTDKLRSDFAKAEKADSGRLFADIARLPRKGYAEIADAAAKVREISERQFKAVDLALSLEPKQAVASLRQMAADYKDMPPGVDAEIRLAEVEVQEGSLASAVQRVKAVLRVEGQEGYAVPLERAQKLMERILAAGEERIAAARKLGLGGDRPKAAAALRQIAVDFAGTGVARAATETAKSFE
jgi:hypothetical protein